MVSNVSSIGKSKTKSSNNNSKSTKTTYNESIFTDTDTKTITNEGKSHISNHPSIDCNFNNVINFTDEEIIPQPYPLNHDKLNDQEVLSKFSIDSLPTRDKMTSSSTSATTAVDTTNRLYRLRQYMETNNIDVYIIPSEDEHQSEYTASCDNRREFISGFNGSAGIAIVSLHKAVLSTDGRYFLEAEKQLDNNWKLLKQGVVGYPTWQEWAISELKNSKFKTLSVDPKLISLTLGKFFESKCKEIGGYFKPLYNNFIDEIWDDQPQRSHAPVYELSYKFTGESAKDKIARIRTHLQQQNASGVIVTKLDEIAWCLNLRGTDFPNSPLFFAYLIIAQDEVRLYIDPAKLPKTVNNYLNVEIKNLKIKEYSAFWIDLSALAINFESYYYLLSNDVSYGLVKKLAVVNYKFSNFIEVLKSIKNLTELYGMKLAHLKDGIALVRYFAWLEEKLIKEGRTLNEWQGALKSEYYRSLMANYKGLSFPTISSSGANAASNHYEPSFENNSIIDPKQIYLCDSGAQYYDGTTDITRTLHFTKPTKEEKIAYTAVLKGHIALAAAQFPQHTTGITLDTLARAPLWQEGLDYRHGTGHGIGSFLNVHEGPVYFGRACTFEPGQIISDEPGYYKDYAFGVRIESDLEVLKNDKVKDLNGLEFLKFGYLTLCPFDLNLIVTRKLTGFEIDWINAYHGHLRNVLTPYLMKLNDLRAAKWLYKQTNPL